MAEIQGGPWPGYKGAPAVLQGDPGRDTRGPYRGLNKGQTKDTELNMVERLVFSMDFHCLFTEHGEDMRKEKLYPDLK